MADHAERGNAIRAAIINDDVEIRSGLRRVIEHAEGFACKGVYGCCDDAMGQIESDLPDVVLMDIGAPRKRGNECVEALKERFPISRR